MYLTGRIWKLLGFVQRSDNKRSAKPWTGGCSFGNEKTPEEPHPGFGFPLWLAQVEASLETRQTPSSQVSFILLSTMACPGGSEFGHATFERRTTKSGYHRGNLGGMPFRDRHDGFGSPNVASIHARQSAVDLPPHSLPLGQAKVESKNEDAWKWTLSGFQIRSHLGKPGRNARMKTLGRRRYLVSKFAPTWASQGGKLDNQPLSKFAGHSLFVETDSFREFEFSPMRSVTSINRIGATTTNASATRWTATFSDSVQGVVPAGFSLAATGTVGASLSQVTGSGSVDTVRTRGVHHISR